MVCFLLSTLTSITDNSVATLKNRVLSKTGVFKDRADRSDMIEDMGFATVASHTVCMLQCLL